VKSATFLYVQLQELEVLEPKERNLDSFLHSTPESMHASNSANLGQFLQTISKKFKLLIVNETKISELKS